MVVVERLGEDVGGERQRVDAQPEPRAGETLESIYFVRMH